VAERLSILALLLSACSGGGVDCPTPGPSCVEGFNHVCSDVVTLATCVDGVWACTGGTRPEPVVDCWCYGPAADFCTCTPSGWVCRPDGGAPERDGGPLAIDAGPPDAGEPDASGPRSDGGGFFACGPAMHCVIGASYCAHQVSDVVGVPDDYDCRAFPPDCASCDCLFGDSCAGEPETGITVTYFGG
jgi:hypothetical protein